MGKEEEELRKVAGDLLVNLAERVISFYHIQFHTAC